MKPTGLSDTLRIRRLCSGDVGSIYVLCKANKTYYRYFKTASTHENIIEDLSRIPPGKIADDKYFLDFFQKDQTLTTILDLIFDYLRSQATYIGLFTLDVLEQGRGIGSNIMKGVFKQLASRRIICVCLDCIHGNVRAVSFWKRNGFYSPKEQLQAVDNQVNLVERVLRKQNINPIKSIL